MGLGMAFCNLSDGVYITGTLRDGGMSGCVRCGGVDYVIDTLGDLCVFNSSFVCVKRWGCSVGDFLQADGLWSLIKLLAAVVSRLSSLIDVSPFPFDTPLDDCSRFWMALMTRLACVMVGFVMFLCWKITVSDTHSALVFLAL